MVKFRQSALEQEGRFVDSLKMVMRTMILSLLPVRVLWKVAIAGRLSKNWRLRSAVGCIVQMRDQALKEKSGFGPQPS